MRYLLRMDAEVPARSLPEAIERFLRLLRPRVRDRCRPIVTYCAAYRGSLFLIEARKGTKPPPERVDPSKLRRRRKLRRAR